jgi:hypothetical protein
VKATQATTNLEIRNRVTYQGITYTICTRCFEVIASGRVEMHLVAAERFHECSSMNSEGKQEDGKRISTQAS